MHRYQNAQKKRLWWCRLISIVALMNVGKAWALEPEPAQASVSTHEEPLKTSIHVDVSALKADAPSFNREGPASILNHLHKNLPNALEKAGLRIVEQDADAQVYIKLKWLNPKFLEYLIEIELHYLGKPTASTLDAFTCKGCMDNSVIDSVLLRSRGIAQILQEERENTRVASQLSPDGPPKNQQNENQNSSSSTKQNHNNGSMNTDQPQKIKTLKIAGWTVFSSGLGSLLAGTVLYLQKDKTYVSPDDFNTIETKTFRPAGISMLSVGAGLIVGGGTMLVVHYVRENKKKKKQSSSSKQVSIYPFFNHHALGMGISSRF